MSEREPMCRDCADVEFHGHGCGINKGGPCKHAQERATSMPAIAWLYPSHERSDRGTYADVCPVPGEAFPYVRKPRWRTVGRDDSMMPKATNLPTINRKALMQGKSGCVAIATLNGSSWHTTHTRFPILEGDRWIYLDEVLALLD